MVRERTKRRSRGKKPPKARRRQRPPWGLVIEPPRCELRACSGGDKDEGGDPIDPGASIRVIERF